MGHGQVEFGLAPAVAFFDAVTEGTAAGGIVSARQLQITEAKLGFSKLGMLGNDSGVNLLRFIEISLLFADPDQLVLEVAPVGGLFDCPHECHARTVQVSDFRINGAQLNMSVSRI